MSSTHTHLDLTMDSDVLWKAARGRAFPQDLENAPLPAARVSHSSHSPCQRPRQSEQQLKNRTGFAAGLTTNQCGQITCYKKRPT